MRHCTVLEYFLEPLESLESENFWFANKTLRGLEALEWLRASSQCAYRAGSFSSTPPLSPTGRFSWPWAVNDVINHANAMKLLKHTHSHTQTHAHTYTHVHIYTHMCKHAHTHKDTQTHIHTCTQYTHLYTHTQMDTHIHTDRVWKRLQIAEQVEVPRTWHTPSHKPGSVQLSHLTS